PGGLIAAEGVLPPRGNADFRLQLQGVDLAEARRVFPALPDARGTLTLDATIQGQVNDPRLHIDARVDSLRYGGVTSDSLQVHADYAAGRMTVNGGVRVAGREVVNAVASIPMRLSLGGIVPGLELLRDQPLSATLTADSVPLGLITQSFPTYLEDGAGVMRARVVVGGTPARPTVNGDAVLQDGEITVTRLGARWTRMNGRLSMHGDTIRVDSLTAHTGSDGRALVNGTVLLDDGAHPRIDLAVSLDDFQVAENRDLADIQSNARVRLSGRVPNVVVTGSVEIEDGTIYIPSINAAAEADIVDADVGALGADTVSAPTTAQALMGALIPRELRILVGESVWLQSPDARIQIRGELTVNRPPGTETNLIYGELDAVRGSYTVEFPLIRRQFDIVQGAVRFYGTPELNPSLDITAAYRVRGGTSDQPLNVLVHLTGTLEQPQVELSTDNRVPLSQSELASLLLFGRTSAQAAGPEELLSGLVLQEALANLIVGQIESALVNTGFVDFVRVRTSTATGSAAGGAGGAAYGLGFLGALTVEIGKEVVSNVYLTGEIVNVLSQPQLGVGVDWQISPTLSLRGAWEPVTRDPLVRNLFRLKRQVTVDLRRRWEYGRPNVRPRAPPRRDPEQTPPAQPSTPTGQPPPTPPGGDGGARDEDDDTEG
ncbi:MAG TPA: translocation/assembly module TamB domain-containing protein, partial [Longimicrobium sp.]|nr:translocation/assembly module TamB domain-containing protein [Longimicrobium sp.]